MKKNVGKKDRAVRLAIAAALYIAGLTAPVGEGLRAILFILTGVAVLTAVFNF
jgi:hypothetical protein